MNAAFSSSVELPGDIRLMNATAALLAFAGAALLAAVALLWIARQPVFAVRGVQVDGDLTHNTASTIRAHAAPRLAGNFFTMDLAATRRAFEGVPWVRQAVVRRVWPNRLAVRLEEHRAVALWATHAPNGDEAADKLVNSRGEVFEANLGDVEDDALPTLRGPDAASSTHMLALLARLQPVIASMNAVPDAASNAAPNASANTSTNASIHASIHPSTNARIETLRLSGRGSWRIQLDTGTEIELGRGSDDEVVARTQAFVGTLPQVVAHFQRPLRYADLRHRDGYAVQLKGVSTTVDAPTTATPPKK